MGVRKPPICRQPLATLRRRYARPTLRRHGCALVLWIIARPRALATLSTKSTGRLRYRGGCWGTRGDANDSTSHVCDRLIFDAERSIAGVADVPRGLRLPTGLTGIGSRPAAIAFFRRGKVTQLLTLILSGGSARMSLQSGQTNSIAVWWTKLNFTAAISSKQLQLGHRSLPISTSSTTPSLRTGIQQILARKN